jgi:hypothetical protein
MRRPGGRVLRFWNLKAVVPKALIIGVSLGLLASSATALGGSAVAVRAAPVGEPNDSSSAAAPVSVSPQAGLPTDTYAFSLSGFASGESILISFSVPEGTEGLSTPDSTTVTADSSGSGSFSLRPVDQWGPTAPGDWTVTFTGQTSGVTQSVTVEIECACG